MRTWRGAVREAGRIVSAVNQSDAVWLPLPGVGAPSALSDAAPSNKHASMTLQAGCKMRKSESAKNDSA